MAPRRRTWLDAAPLRRARRRLQRGHRPPGAWKHPLPPPPAVLETVELRHTHRINGAVYAGRIQVPRDLATMLRAAEGLAAANDRVWMPRRELPPQPTRPAF